MSARRRVTLRAQWLGQQLRELRDANELTLNDAADYLQRNNGTVSRFETGEYPIRRPDLMALLDLYGVSDGQRRSALMKLSEEVWQKGWWDGYAEDVAGWLIDYVWLESRAETIHTFDITAIHGLLQTRDYAEALIRTTDPEASDVQVDRWVELRMTRQEILDREDSPHLSVILDEAALRRTVSGPQVMVTQLSHLVAYAQRPNIEIRILPFRAGAHPSTAGAFRILTMADPFPEVAYVESPAGTVYIETPETDRLVSLYDRLWRQALGQAESVEWISKTAEELR